ncbi:uncharacterized mitochondrial protein AtMg00810-like [Lycium ferocissimum]|uniref:uncharacterized mitochondrial protein AtMg00810-like n=1 Tax=Lycium ferocissimum TaxID=112874 RepID=UPI0028165A8E|nr:uncharacterized mitochondrial protein AtMg00810-like [Lycium ferocissimum]
MELPPGLSVHVSSVPLVCKLQKSLGSGDSLVILVVYVDDIVLTGTDLEEINALKSFFHEQFRNKDLGLLRYFLGIEVLCSPNRVLLHQSKFVGDLLKKFQPEVCSPVICPLELNEKLKSGVGDPLPKPDVYRSLDLSHFMQYPFVPHMRAAIHLLRYLRGTSGLGLFFNNSADLSLKVYCGSDWASCPDSRSWKAKKQLVISWSSAESEYRSLSKAVGEITWLSRLLTDFGFPPFILQRIQSFMSVQSTLNLIVILFAQSFKLG